MPWVALRLSTTSLLKVALPDDLKAIGGAQELQDWFGYWPSFHDGEIISLRLNRTCAGRDRNADYAESVPIPSAPQLWATRLDLGCASCTKCNLQ